MSIAWWNPMDRSMIADSYQTTHGGFKALSTKCIQLSDGGLLASVGDARFRARIRTNDIPSLDGQPHPADLSDSSALHYRKGRLSLLTMHEGIFVVYGLPVDQYYAIGHGAAVVMVLSDLGFDDDDAIGDALLLRIPYISAPFTKIKSVD